MSALPPVNRPLFRQSYRFFPHMTVPHPRATPATLAVFATYCATFIATLATFCRSNRPSSPMNPGIALVQHQKAAKTAMFTIPVNIAVTTAANLHSAPPPCTSPSSLSSVVILPLSSSVSSVVALVFVRHGRLTCDPPDAYSTGAIWDRLPNLSRVPPHERPPAPVMTTAADRPDSSIEEPPWLFAPS